MKTLQHEYDDIQVSLTEPITFEGNSSNIQHILITIIYNYSRYMCKRLMIMNIAITSPYFFNFLQRE